MTLVRLIIPYKCKDVWVFDDESKGLYRTAFSSGIGAIVDELVAAVSNAEEGFKLLFAPTPFPGYHAELEWLRGEHGGNWYEWRDKQMEAWLSPPLYAYFNTPPRKLYCRVEPLH